MRIPAEGWAKEHIISRLQSLKENDVDWQHGRAFSLVYPGSAEHLSIIEKAHNMYLSENALNPFAFQSLRRLEAEVVRMTASMLHGDANAVGTMTSGGTESILLAVKAARDLARSKRRRFFHPNIVVPESAHVAFDKAAHFLGCEIRYTRLDASMRADVKDMESLIDANTVLLVASAPQYPHGVIDPIPEIAELAQKRKIPLHVDACIGGFFLPWAERLGKAVPPWDFRVKGVTSISADVHKFGYGAKGASVLVYRSMELLRHQFFVSSDWPGGIYASPTLLGTRGGGPIAAAWAAIMAMGEKGYMQQVERALRATQRLVEGIEATGRLRLVTKPDMSIVAWTTRKESRLDIFAIAEKLEERGWLVDRQQHPNSIHCTVMAHHEDHIDEYLSDINDSIAFLEGHPNYQVHGNAAIYGMAARLPLRGMVKQGVLDLMERLYGPKAGEPGHNPLVPEQRRGLHVLWEKYGPKALAWMERLGLRRDRRKHS
ncbi:MAG: aspartate aminotransferase family protein [Sandaracinaceae bacterium]|nr:aspartate aminotransferase family protein [Sandaracinaceae bacterium]